MKKPQKSDLPVEEQLEAVVAQLKRLGSKSVRDGMKRYGLPSDNAVGIPVGKIQQIGKDVGHNHELAQGLWDTGIYEAQMLAAFVDEPELVTPAQMDRWCKEFNNWGIVDTVCFKLFDQTPHAWKKVAQWSKRREEFQKRAGFVLLACLAAHDKKASNDQFISCLTLIEEAATDERNFVKKGLSWALRGIGRRNAELNSAAAELARRLADATDATSRWLGKEALREFKRPVVIRQMQKLKQQTKKAKK